MAMADPFVVVDPKITIDSIDFKCASRMVSLIPEDNEADIETFCNPGGTRPGSTNWTCSIEVVLSYGVDASDSVDGSWNQLNAMRKQKKTIVVGPSDDTIGTDNPTATFSAYIPSIPFMDGTIGEAQTFTLELSSVGDPVFATS
jgi:hypothetical protein